MTSLRTALAAVSCVSILALGACATTPRAPMGDQQAAAAPPLVRDDVSTYGLFLAASKAYSNGDMRDAADLFAAAARREDGQPVLLERAFKAALIAGDVHKAATLAPPLVTPTPIAGGSTLLADDEATTLGWLGRLTQAVDAIADGRGRQAQMLLTTPPLRGQVATAGVLLTPWAAAAAGDWQTALAAPVARGDRMNDEIADLSHAMLLERRHRFDAADAAYRKLVAEADGSSLYTNAYGAFLERRGRRADAIALYKTAIQGDASSHALPAALARVEAGKPAPAELTIAQGAAQTLLGPTVLFLQQKQPMGLAYLRLVLRLDPGRDEAWVLVGDVLAPEDPAGAREAYSHPQPGSPEFIDSRARLITTYDGDASANSVVLQIAQDTVKGAPGDDDALTLLADALRVNSQYAESAKVLDKLIADQGDKASWQLYYMRGVALEQAGQWPAAEADMQKALALSPDEPEVLNYLGYSWIDRGVHLREGKAMIEKAVAAKPDSGAIADSLGWAYFRLGDYKKAVDQLEHASELDAADPDVNNHLGDAYWRAGRKTEARFQWERVLTLNPSAKLRGEAESKLKGGLDGPNRVAEATTAATQ
jgi:Flp pilus assembly protein TadD